MPDAPSAAGSPAGNTLEVGGSTRGRAGTLRKLSDEQTENARTSRSGGAHVRGACPDHGRAHLRDRVGVGVPEGPVEVLLAARERRGGALAIRGAPGRRGGRIPEAPERVLAEGAEDERLAVPRPRAERGLRRRPGREREGDREPADLGTHVRRRAVVARRVLGVPADDGIARRARRALVRAAVAEVRRRVADRARLDGGGV